MIENNNKNIVNIIAEKSFRANKSRNRFAIIAIALTALLFTALFTITMSMNKSVEYSEMRMVGTTFHGQFKDLTHEQYDILKNNKLIKKIGISVQVGLAENKEFSKRQTEIKYADENYIKEGFSEPSIGNIPKNKDEILIDTITLKKLGLPNKINQNINIIYTLDGKKYNKKFNVSGVYEGDIVSNASILYVSKDFIKEELANIDVNKSKKDGTYAGLIALHVNFSNPLFTENKLLKVIEDSGFSTNDIDYGINWAYNMSSNIDESIRDIIGLSCFVILIIISGYLIIYNIFYISIVKEIKFYGLLKTIGTTKKQIKKIIRKQALILASVGIPMGIILGYGIGVILVPVMMNTLEVKYTKVSLSPAIFIGTILFSLVTIFISIKKPAKIAAKVSPIEALRYSGIDERSKKKSKKTANGAKLYKMALSNILRNKKKTFIVVASLSLSIIILNTAYTIVAGFDKDKYLIPLIGSDFTVGDESFYRWRYNSDTSKSLTEELCKEIENVSGVKSVNKIYYREIVVKLPHKIDKYLDKIKNNLKKDDIDKIDEMQKRKTTLLGYYGIDDGVVNMLDNYMKNNKIDKEKFKTGNYVIVQESYELGKFVDVGDKVTIPYENGKTKDYTVLGVIPTYLPLYLYTGYSITGEINCYMPSNEFKNTTSNNSVMTAMFDVKDKKDIKKVDEFINSKIKEDPKLDYRSKIKYENEFKEFYKSYELIGYALSFIIGLIGIVNFTNVIITSIVSRKKELAMLKSIGMTDSQVTKMIVLEGLYYAIITIMVVVAIGTPITYLGAEQVAGMMDMFTYKFRILPLIVTLPMLVLISLLIPNICIKRTKNNNIIESLREVE